MIYYWVVGKHINGRLMYIKKFDAFGNNLQYTGDINKAFKYLNFNEAAVYYESGHSIIKYSPFNV